MDFKSEHCRTGRAVKEGDLLAQIDDTDAELDQRRAEHDLEIADYEASNDVALRSARKARDYAAAHYARAQTLRRSSCCARSTHLTATTAADNQMRFKHDSIGVIRFSAFDYFRNDLHTQAAHFVFPLADRG